MNKRFFPQIFKILSFIIIIVMVFSFTIYAKEDENFSFETYNSIIKEIKKLDENVKTQNIEYEKVSQELKEAELVYKIQMDISKKHIKYVYENTFDSIVSQVLSSKDYGKINSNIENIHIISTYDNKSIKKLRKAKNRINKNKKKLKKIKDDLNLQMNDLLTKKKEAEELIAKEAEEKRAEMMEYLNNFGVDVDKMGSNTPSLDNSSINYIPSESEILFLAAVLQAEAGPKNYVADAAVATVVCNRVLSPLFPNNLYDVLVQPRQFSTVPGRVTTILNQGVSDVSLQAAINAINGERIEAISGYLYFCSAGYAASRGIRGINIGGNVFH